MRLEDSALLLLSRGSVLSMPMDSVAAPPVVDLGLLGATISIPTSGPGDALLKGARPREAKAFAAAVENAWVHTHLAALERQAGLVDWLHRKIVALDHPSRYPAACEIGPIFDDAKALDASLLSKLQARAIGPEAAERIALIRAFVANPQDARNAAIEAFVADELERYREFFDTVESKPLTPEQRLSVVVDEDATLVLAGAGSGKTSVITAKAAYLVKAGICSPEEILLIAFARNAAKEMSERVEARSGAGVAAQTFHALAYDIIGKVEGSKPALAEHATDDLAFNNLIKQILKDLVAAMSEVSRAIIRWFAHFLVEPKSEWDFKTKHAFYSHLEKQDLRTLQGEKVKSYEELQIANWLYENGIAYEYEPDYEHEIQGTGRRNYCPDFRLTESGIYIEHFGVRRQTGPDGKERLYTAPFVKREPYLAGMEWKRQVHAEHETTLVETYSYERQEGRLLISLAEKLAPYVTLNPRPTSSIFDRIIELNQVDAFSKMLGTFLLKFKGGGYSIEGCEAKATDLKLGDRATAFLSVFSPVFKEYHRRLGGRIDFEDMILRAVHYVENGQYVSRYTHILVDEFQDISQSRARLVKGLKAQRDNARVFAVGDDWQSIFGFAGSDIHIMRHFGVEFGGRFDGEDSVHRVVDLGRTFRSVDQIAFAARDFVLRNPAQLTKQIIPAGVADGPVISILHTLKSEEQKTLVDVLSGLASRVPGKSASTVLLLGRYRFVQPEMLALKRQFPGLVLNFKTIHASKGLEADHVILLQANSGRMGFPSEIVDDPLLALVSPEPERFENAEERRVMYVAMTRARHTLTILASKSRPSSFVTELGETLAASVARSTKAQLPMHECGECGGRLLDVRGKDGRVWYRCEHDQHCENFMPACPSCGSDIPRQVLGSPEARCSCGSSFPACPDCDDGWLVERTGRYGGFLGCVRFPQCSGKAKMPKAS